MATPHIVELAGVAGAGKTTLAHTLSQRYDWIQICDQPFYRHVVNIPYFTWNSLLMAPTLIRLRQRNDLILISPRIAAWMVNLNGWWKKLYQQKRSRKIVCIMDRGPLSIMAEILFLFPEALQDSTFVNWWDQMFFAWMDCLDLIVWLDAADQTLIERVRQRRTSHTIMDLAEDEALQFNQKYRSIYQGLLSSITNYDRPKIMSIDTGQQTFDEVLHQVAYTLGSDRSVLHNSN